MTEIMPHSENIVNLFYWTPLSRDSFFSPEGIRSITK